MITIIFVANTLGSGQDSSLWGGADFYEVYLRVNLEPVISTGMLFPHVTFPMTQ
ncbi:MAG TPA: hypothetical protein PLE99_09780 [Candidatus Thiothrix moscowensis]|uniref:hypothetical protein n=1 Tax=uncultured Thiothrix sp. TaxID=223185 RepID=UPI002632616F|nr:hypothetical protein [uncultured Thiothrix sp.]HRJ53048.1 hypothetical protein [Candidatus Thiothrix moscowensis]HRJ93039.1 hypothetical protein [Candidatus Thiothrix moscowensis]